MNNMQENNEIPQTTVMSAKNALLNYFISHDNIKYSDLGQFISHPLQDKEAVISTYLISLQELTNENIISLNILSDPKNFNSLRWSLKKSLFLHDQTIKISGITALRIASIVNSISEEEGCDMLAITDNDLCELLDFTNHLSFEIEEMNDLEEMKEQNPPDSPNKKKNK